MEHIKCMCNGLNDPHLTAKFQRLCGISKCKDVDESLKFKSTGTGDVDSTFSVDKENNNYVNNGQKVSDFSEACQQTTQRAVSQKTKTIPNGAENVKVFIRYPILHYILTLSSSLGNEAFYLVFYPYMVWNVDCVLIRKAALIWCLSMYVGQATKDFLQWPRPSAPPVIRLETEFLQESGMPSTHAMSATAIPFMLAYLSLQRYEISPWIVVPVAVIWCTLVCLSRLYQGVHSVLDVVCGVLLTVGIIFLAGPYLDDFDWYQQTHPFSQIVIFVTSVALCTVLYPATKDINSAKGDAVQIVSVTSGFSLGTWLNYHYGFTTAKQVTDLYPVLVPTIRMLAVSVVRFFVGAVILAGIQLMLKEVSIRLLSYCFGLKTPNKKHPSVQTGYKFIVYYTLGFCICFLVPFVHCMFGLERPSYFTEGL